MDQGSVATERGALREACVSSLNRSYFRHEYSPSPVVSSQSHLIPDLRVFLIYLKNTVFPDKDLSKIWDQFWCVLATVAKFYTQPEVAPIKLELECSTIKHFSD